MTDIYVERELIADQNGTEKPVAEADILSLGLPLIVLGDPGMGKTKLTECLATRLGVPRISSGAFVRSANLESLKPPDGLPIIVDGSMSLRPLAVPRRSTRSLRSFLRWPIRPSSCRAELQTGTVQ
jgi:hypothetical protein